VVGFDRNRKLHIAEPHEGKTSQQLDLRSLIFEIIDDEEGDVQGGGGMVGGGKDGAYSHTAHVTKEKWDVSPYALAMRGDSERAVDRERKRGARRVLREVEKQGRKEVSLKVRCGLALHVKEVMVLMDAPARYLFISVYIASIHRVHCVYTYIGTLIKRRLVPREETVHSTRIDQLCIDYLLS
jgi:hypothetical protein